MRRANCHADDGARAYRGAGQADNRSRGAHCYPAAPTAVPAAKLDMAALVDKYITAIPDGYYGMAPAAAKEQIDATKPFLLDVRESKEISDTGTISGSVNIPLRSLTKNLDKLPAQDKPIIVYCAVGYRGPIAMEALQLLGHRVINAEGFLAPDAAEVDLAAVLDRLPAGDRPDLVLVVERLGPRRVPLNLENISLIALAVSGLPSADRNSLSEALTAGSGLTSSI